MTLLLAARGREHIVVLSDGVSLVEQGGEPMRVEQSALVKQFELEGLPAVIAHHGQNRLGSVSVGRFVDSEPFQNAISNAWPAGLNRVLAAAITQFDTPVVQTLEAVENRKTFGLWFAGFWTCTDIPEVAEIIWQKSAPGRTRIRCHPLGDLSVGGSGFQYLKDVMKKPIDGKYEYDKIMQNPPEYSMEFMKAMYREALKRQGDRDPPVFGGTATMTLITPDGVDTGPIELSAVE